VSEPDAQRTNPIDATDPASWVRSVHAQHAGALFVFAYRATGDRGVAEEIVQDTLVRAWQHADRFDPAQGSLGTWLFAIARNLVVDAHRRRSARPQAVASLDDEAAQLHAPVEAGQLDRAMEAWQVADALQRLTPDHRAAIVETYYRGASIAEAAATLGVPEGTVKSRLYYGLRSLRLVLEEMGVIG
jgi:RNA polymerase sigma-70 factor, ECF subfamily